MPTFVNASMLKYTIMSDCWMCKNYTYGYEIRDLPPYNTHL